MTDLEMLLKEKNDLDQKIAKAKLQFSLVTQKITVRKLEVQILGRDAKKGRTTDSELIKLYAMSDQLNPELCEMKKTLKALKKEIAAIQAEAPKPEKKPRGDRPKNRVYMGREFYDCNSYERRLALLMAYEIGQERYDELKRQAGDDTRTGETAFYTGGQRPRWDDTCRKQNDHEDFERMMRSNRNSFAGSEI